MKKEGLAARVVDRRQVLRSMSKEELSNFFNFDDDESLKVLPESNIKNGHATVCNNSKRVEDSLKLSSFVCPKSCSSDKLMKKLLDQHRPRYFAIKFFFSHIYMIAKDLICT